MSETQLQILNDFGTCRCFASAPYSMATYDRLVQYTRAEHLAQPTPQPPPAAAAAPVEPSPRSSSPEHHPPPRRSRWDETRVGHMDRGRHPDRAGVEDSIGAASARKRRSESPRRRLRGRRRGRSRSVGRGESPWGRSPPAASPERRHRRSQTRSRSRFHSQSRSRSRSLSRSLSRSRSSLPTQLSDDFQRPHSSGIHRRQGHASAPRQPRHSRSHMSSRDGGGGGSGLSRKRGRPTTPRQSRRSRGSASSSSQSPRVPSKHRQDGSAPNVSHTRRRDSRSWSPTRSSEGARQAAPLRREPCLRRSEAGAEGLGPPERVSLRLAAGGKGIGLAAPPGAQPFGVRTGRGEFLPLGPEGWAKPEAPRDEALQQGPRRRGGSGGGRPGGLAATELQQLREQALSRLPVSEHVLGRKRVADNPDKGDNDDRWEMS